MKATPSYASQDPAAAAAQTASSAALGPIPAAVVYASKHGTTAMVSEMVAKQIPGATLINLEDDPEVELKTFGTVIVGGPIYAGQLFPPVRAFSEKREAELCDKQLGLFICGMEPDPVKRQRELDDAYPSGLAAHAKAAAFLGGRFLMSELSFAERTIIRMFTRSLKDVFSIDNAAITRFAAEMNS